MISIGIIILNDQMTYDANKFLYLACCNCFSEAVLNILIIIFFYHYNYIFFYLKKNYKVIQSRSRVSQTRSSIT